MTSLQWMDDALCREVGQDLFFPEAGTTPREAKQICAACPVRNECLTHALRSQVPVHGVWGGTTENERRSLRRRIA